MSGNQIIDVRQPSRGALFAKMLSDMITQHQQQQRESEDADNVQQDKADQILASQYVKLNPADQANAAPHLTEGAKKYILQYTHQQTLDEQLHDLVTSDTINAWNADPRNRGLAPGGVQAGRYQTAFGVASPSEVTKAGVAQDVYTNPNSPPQMVQRQGVEDKTALSAEQQKQADQNDRDYSTIKLPESKAKIGNENAQASEHTAKAKAAGVYLPDTDTGAPNQAVQNVVATVRAAAQRGISPDVVLKRITDKNLKNAVNAELTKPQNQDIMSGSPLTPAGQKALAELDPVEKQVDNIISLLAPHKDDNLGGLRMATVKYKLGFSSDDPAPIASELSRLNLGQIQAIMPFASKSRNYQYIKDIKQHTWDTSKDTFKNMYDKAVIIKQNMQNMRAATNKYERIGATGDGTTQPEKQNDPLGILP